MTALEISLLLCAAGMAVAALEDLRAFAVFRDDGLLSWRVAGLRVRWMHQGRSGRAFGRAFAGERYRAVLWAVVAVAALAPLTAVAPFLTLPVAVALLAGLMLMSVRSLYGLDGSDQMHLVILAGASLAAVAPGSTAAELCVWFVAIQLTLAYTIAGLAKAASPVWRRGDALVGIMSTSSYGNEWAYQLLRRRPWLGRLLGWSVIVVESTFAIGFLLPGIGPLVLLVVMGAFHVSCAALMGLNNFLFAFVAAYPAWWVVAAG